jgi:hypothetical protein
VDKATSATTATTTRSCFPASTITTCRSSRRSR